MTPETAKLLLQRQSPEQRKVMLFALRISDLAIDRFMSGRADLPPGVDDWLSGRYAMTAESDGYVLVPQRPTEQRSMPGRPPAQPVATTKPGAITGPIAMGKSKPVPDRPVASPPAKPLPQLFRRG